MDNFIKDYNKIGLLEFVINKGELTISNEHTGQMFHFTKLETKKIKDKINKEIN